MKSVGLSLLVWLTLIFSPPLQARCIGVVTAGGGPDYWQFVEQGAKQAGRELGVGVVVGGAADEINTEGQRTVIRSILSAGCKAVVLAPNSPELKKDVAMLKAQGIPTVFVDRDYGGDRVSVIKTANFSAGEVAAHEMQKVLGTGGKVALLRMDKSVLPSTLREDGFAKVAGEAGLDIVIEVYLCTMVEEERATAYSVLKQHPNIDGVFTPNQSTSVAVLKALQQLGRAGKVVHIGFDSHPSVIEGVRNGEVYGFVLQQPFVMGYKGVYAAYYAMRGIPFQQVIDVPVRFVDRTNINDSDVRKALGIEASD